MSLILCRQEHVEHPYFIENLGIHIHSSQELCYVIYHHPLLALDGFLDMHLMEFIRDELDLGFLALKLERWLKSGENPDEALFLILQECDYYNTAELNRFRQMVNGLRKLPAAEYAKRKADYFFQYKQYGKAIAGYEALLEEETSYNKMDSLFWGKVWNNLGAAYARIFHFDKAFQAFDKAYNLMKELRILEKMFHLTLLKQDLALKERYQAIISQELQEEWVHAFESVREQAQQAPEVQEIEELFRKDPIKRMEGATRMIQEWKKEYRSMA